MPTAPDFPVSLSEPPVYHPVAIHRDPEDVHPMVNRHADSFLRRVDRLILAVDTTATPLDASPVPSFIRLPSPTYTGVMLWKMSTRPC
jgi:hypothetical protein